MRKIKLQLDSLAVESFHTAPPDSVGGTVVGQQRTTVTSISCDDSCIQTACTCYQTCPATCNETCYASCGGTCVEYTCANTCVGSCGYCGPATAGTCLLPCV